MYFNCQDCHLSSPFAKGSSILVSPFQKYLEFGLTTGVTLLKTCQNNLLQMGLYPICTSQNEQIDHSNGVLLLSFSIIVGLRLYRKAS